MKSSFFSWNRFTRNYDTFISYKAKMLWEIKYYSRAFYSSCALRSCCYAKIARYSFHRGQEYYRRYHFLLGREHHSDIATLFHKSFFTRFVYHMFNYRRARRSMPSETRLWFTAVRILPAAECSFALPPPASCKTSRDGRISILRWHC